MIELNKITLVEFLKNISFPSHINNTANTFHPLLLAQDKENTLLLIDGYKRIQFYKKQKIQKAPCSIVEKLDYENCEKLLLCYIKYNIVRGINDIEISNIIIFAENFLKSPKIIKNIFSYLNLKYSEKSIKYFKNINKLTKRCKLSLINNSLNRKSAVIISELTSVDQELFLKLFLNMKLNGNKQKKICDMILDLAKRDDKSPCYIIRNYFPEFLSTNFSKEKETEFFEKLLKLHSPHYFCFNEKFKRFKKEFLKNGTGFNLYSPSGFEDSTYKMEIFFKDINELQEKLHQLNKRTERLKEKDEFKELFQ